MMTSLPSLGTFSSHWLLCLAVLLFQEILIAHFSQDWIDPLGQTSHLQTRRELLQCIKGFNLIDVWRNKYLNHLVSSCYSNTFQTFSRIVLVSADLISSIINCWYDSIIISDHASVSFLIKLPNYVAHLIRWQLIRA